MKSFDDLWIELVEKVNVQDPHSTTLTAISSGTHAIAKKILEEAGEVMLAAESQGNEELATEISQLLYWIQVLMIQKKVDLEDVYRRL